MMNRLELMEKIRETISDLFLEYQTANDIPSGDIDLDQASKLTTLERDLMKLIIKQGQFARNVTYTPCYAQHDDITFIIKETWNPVEDSSIMECIGWHFGEPTEEDTLDPEREPWINNRAEL